MLQKLLILALRWQILSKPELQICNNLHFLQKVASSECSEDRPSIVFEDQLATEEECINFCQTFAASALGCSFAAWTGSSLGGKCVLYNEAFADFIANCELLSGPPDLSGCPVDDPTESSCDGVR